MQIFHGVKNLIKYSTCCPLLESHLSRHDSKEFPLLCELCDYVDEICGLDYFVEIDDVGMPDFLHNLHLPLDADLIVLVFDRSLINYFHCYFLTSREMNTFLNLAKRSLAESLLEFVVANSSDCLFLTATLLHAFDSHLI